MSAALLLALGAAPLPVGAEENSIPYVERTWQNGQIVETNRVYQNAVWMTDGHTQLHHGWWYTRDVNVDINEPIAVDAGATASIILMDGVTMNFKEGIYVPQGATLNIYGGPAGTGRLYVHTDKNCAPA